MAPPNTPRRYTPRVFETASMAQARKIILQGDDPEQIERRWEVETPWFGNLIVRACGVTASSRVLDFGCGIGRLSRQIIVTSGCSAVGVDISASMRAMAAGFVASPCFKTASYEEFGFSPPLGDGFDAAFACYVLQHVEQPERDLGSIAAALRPGGSFLLVNSTLRWVPTIFGWEQDRLDVAALADKEFELVETFSFPPEIAVIPDLVDETVIRLYRKR